MPKIEKTINAYRILVQKPLGKCQIGKLRWENNIKVDLKETDCDNGKWGQLIQNHVHVQSCTMEHKFPLHKVNNTKISRAISM